MKRRGGDPVIRAFTDGEDLYNYSMGYLFQRWPEARFRYRYIQRTPGFRFPAGFAARVREEVEHIGSLRLQPEEFAFFETMPWFPRPYLQWLAGIRLDASCVEIRQDGEGRLDLRIEGRGYEVVYWEVKLLATISELWHRQGGGAVRLLPGWEEVIRRKAEALSAAGVQWIDFGTRRRAAYEVQDAVVRIMKEYPGFRGTSNVHLAARHDVKATGTYAHQLPMAMQALYGPQSADRMAMQHWTEAYGGRLGIALSDTLTTEAFLREFGPSYANLFTGVRQDSGDPIAFGERMIAHYEALGIEPRTKIIVFSDGLDPARAIELHRHFHGRVRPTMGIGTNLTADPAMTGRPALNQVIKLTEADFGRGFEPVVKLSDEPGKGSGDPEQVRLVRTLLRV